MTTTKRDFTNWLPANLTAAEITQAHAISEQLKSNPVAVTAFAIALLEEINMHAEAQAINDMLINVVA